MAAMTRPLVALAALLLLLVACEQQKQAITETLPTARAEKARGDAQVIVAAVKMYSTTLGALPDSIEALTAPATVGGVTGGPFLGSVPTPPPGWSAYRYEKREDGTFQVTSAGEGMTVSAP